MRALTERPGAAVAGEVSLGTRKEWEAVLDVLIDRAHPPDPVPPQPAAGNGERARELHLDLAELAFTDVAGAAALTRAARRLAPQGRLVLHDAPPALCRVLAVLWPEERTLLVCPR